MALEEGGSNILAQHGSGTLFGTPENFRAMFERAVAETQKGVSIEIEMIGVVGRKKSAVDGKTVWSVPRV